MIDDVQIKDSKDIAEQFCEYFANVGKIQSDMIGNTPKSFKTYLETINVENSIYLQPTDEREIIQLVTKMKNKYSSGYDNLTSVILKKVIHGIASPLTSLINRSLCEGIFPRALKLAKIIPIFKKDDREQIGNYRPISLLTTISKVFERVIFNRFYNYLDKYDLFDKQQFGFRPNLSTTDACTVLVKDVLNS